MAKAENGKTSSAILPPPSPDGFCAISNGPARCAAAGKSRDAKAARRMLALALVLEEVDRTWAVATCGMDRQTLRGEEGQETVRGGLLNKSV